MIVYHGTDLEEIAPVKIDDIRVSPIAVQPVTRQRPVKWGQEYVRMTGQARTVAVTFALLNMNRDERYELLTSIDEWARVGEVCELYLPMRAGWHLETVCTGLPEPSYRMWWENKLRLTFTTMDCPYWISDNEQTATFGRDFTVGGNAPPLMRFERTLSTAEADRRYYTDDESMLFTRIPAGRLVIDLNRQISTVGGVNIDQYLTPVSQYITPKFGTQRIRGEGTIIYRERCI